MRYKELENKLLECGIITFEDITLVSGNESKYYIDIKKGITKPLILNIIRRHIIEIIIKNKIKADFIVCVELGGVPIGTAVSLATGLSLIIIRKAQKEYGIKNRIVGDIEKGKIALFLEDVTTTGGSVVSAVQVLRNEGIIVKNVISVVDRDEGAEEALNKEELELLYLIKAKTLLEDYKIRISGGIKTDNMI